MRGKRQLERTVTVEAPVAAVYRLFMDNAELANWAPVVDAVTGEEGGDSSGLGRTRTCAVTLDGRPGTMAEKCIEAVPDARASFLVVDDSFGFNKLFRHYGFTVHFSAAGDERTTVTMESFYTPANPLVAVMNRVVMRRKLTAVVDTLLDGLATLAARRHAIAD